MTRFYEDFQHKIYCDIQRSNDNEVNSNRDEKIIQLRCKSLNEGQLYSTLEGLRQNI